MSQSIVLAGVSGRYSGYARVTSTRMPGLVLIEFLIVFVRENYKRESHWMVCAEAQPCFIAKP